MNSIIYLCPVLFKIRKKIRIKLQKISRKYVENKKYVENFKKYVEKAQNLKIRSKKNRLIIWAQKIRSIRINT